MNFKNKLYKGLQVGVIVTIILIAFIGVFITKAMSNIDADISIFSVENLMRVLGDVSFYSSSIATALFLNACYFGAYTIRRSSLFEAEEFNVVLTRYNDRLKLKPRAFNEYVRYNNLTEKKERYIETQNDLLDDLKNKEASFTNEQMDSKKYKKIVDKIKRVEDSLTEEFINKNITHIKVKYSMINAKNFRQNAYGRVIDDRKDASNEARELSKSAIGKTLSMLITSMLFIGLVVNAAFTFTLDGQFIALITFNILTCLIQITFGCHRANSLFNTEIIQPLENKTNILEDSVVWANKNGNNDETFRSIMESYVNEKLNEENEEAGQEE